MLELLHFPCSGPPNSGKTALAAQLAKNSDFPFVKVCSPEEMVGFTESSKCLQIRKVSGERKFGCHCLSAINEMTLFDLLSSCLVLVL